MANFETKEDLARSLAKRVAATLQADIEAIGRASLALSGGTTPVQFFQHLSLTNISWEMVVVTLVDERCVPPDNPRSNAKLVKDNLLNNKAKSTTFVPLFDPTQDLGSNLVDVTTSLRSALPLTATVLGMGTDGHTASFFPDATDLSIATAPKTKEVVTSIEANTALETRLTLTLPVLLSSKFLALHIEGDAKKKVLEEARQPGEANSLPIRHVLRNRDDLEIFWTP